MRRVFTSIAAALLLAGVGSVAGVTTANAQSAIPRSVVFFTIVSWHSGKCVDDPGGSQTSGAQIQQFTCNGTVSQLWERQPTDSGYFRLRVAASGQCMAVAGASQAEGAPVVQNPCSFDFNQQWREEDSGVPGFPRLVARHSGKVLIMRSEALADRTPLVQTSLPASADVLHSTAWQFR